MQVMFISLVKEPNPYAAKDTVLGRKVTRHDIVGHLYHEEKDALQHQDSLLTPDRGGVILTVQGQ